MKRVKIFAASLCLFFCAAAAFASEAVEIKPYFYDKLIREIEKPQAPVVTDDYIVFTADASNRFVGVAFDFENFQTIHPFQILHTYGIDGEETNAVLFYCYERKHEVSSIKYRLVMDGLWTTDPNNPSKEYDEKINLYFSKLENLGEIATYTRQTDSMNTRFIYKGESGLDLRLAGSFTNWDPWIYTMTETKPGFYELELPLPSGKYYYSFFVGLVPVLDNTNPDKVYTDDGRTANVLVVN
ncbi:MAG: glycogen-binding domain-containing protein [Treponema sp.]|nr:glycogen-binding domain-containing protein [Treponema sp.]